MADATVSKTVVHKTCGFESHLGHHFAWQRARMAVLQFAGNPIAAWREATDAQADGHP